MKVLVTGAAGFIGRALSKKLLSDGIGTHGSTPVTRLILLDQKMSAAPNDPRVRLVEGDIADREVAQAATHGGVDLIFHLASIPGGLAERQFELGLRVNLEATIQLLEVVRQHDVPRFVYASTIGVYGAPLPEIVDENTLPEPTLSYGAQKLTSEILISDYSRRGFIDGCALRLPGIVARPPQSSGMLSAFLSDSIRALAAGRQFKFPVSADGTAWWMSRACAVENLLHAATLPREQLRRRRVWLLPVLHASMAEIVAAAARVHGPHVVSNASYESDAALQAQFASYPPLNCPAAVAVGFRNDGTLEQLVQRSLERD